MKQTTKRNYAFENEMCKAAGLRMTCNACDRLIYEDENWIEEYSTNGGYCKECAEETQQEVKNACDNAMLKMAGKEVSIYNDLRQDALKWWNKLGIKKAECLGNKYYGRDYGIVAIDDTTDEEIEFIYTREVIAMQPKETASSNDSLEREEKWEWKQSRGNNYYEYDIIVSGNKLIHYEGETPEDGKAIVELICKAVNNYNALKQSNKELIEACKGLINQMESLRMNQRSFNLGWSNERINMWSAALVSATNAIEKAKQL